MLRVLLASLLVCASVSAGAPWVDLGNEVFTGDADLSDTQTVIALPKSQAVRIEKNGDGCASAALDLEIIGRDPDTGAPVKLKRLFRDSRGGGVEEYTLFPEARVLGFRFRVRRAGSCFFTFALQESEA